MQPKTTAQLVEYLCAKYPDEAPGSIEEELVEYFLSVEDWVKARHAANFPSEKLSDEDAAYLQPDNPRLLELSRAYDENMPAKATQWDETFLDTELQLHNFRGDNCYVWQARGDEARPKLGEPIYACTAQYVEQIDALGLLKSLSDSPTFGVHSYSFRGRVITRDLLDSIMELNFLASHLPIQHRDVKVLDIGAGYGRFATRCVQAFPKATVYTTDAVAVSTFLCEFYVRHCGLDDRVHTIPFHQFRETVPGDIDLACNIHSFTEISLEFTKHWISEMERLQIPYVFFVPNDSNPTSLESDDSRREIIPEFEKAGYRIKAMSPKYAACLDVERSALYPTDYYLFERKA